MGCHSVLQGILPTQGSNLRLLHWQVDSFTIVPPGKPKEWVPTVNFQKYAINGSINFDFFLIHNFHNTYKIVLFHGVTNVCSHRLHVSFPEILS